ncbi:MAG: outer membrane beta-barrel family protein, partial [Bacteroidales bacterium]
FDLNYRNNKVTVYGSFSYYHSDSKSGSESTTNYADGTLFEMNKNKGEEWLTKDKNNGFHGKFGMDYYIDKTNILSVSYRGNGGNGKSNALNNTRVFPKENAPVLYSYSQGSKSKWESQDHNANLNYEHIFDTVFKRKLFVDFNYIKHHRDIEDISDMLYYQGDFQKEDTTSMYALEAPLSSDIYALKLDYEHPFTQQTKLEVGLKFSFVDNHNQMEYNTAGIIDTNRSNAYRYNELIGAAYAIVNHSFKTKTSLQVGLRAEYTHTMGKSENLDSINTRSYWRPFPNISISQQIGTKNQLSLSYRYRLTRPHYTYLNPFLLRGGVNSYSSGNPLLNPEYSHVLDLSYSFNYKFFATLSYTHSDGMIDYITVYSKEYIAFSQPKNMGRSDQLSLSLSTQLTFFKIWRLNLYLYGGYGRTELFYQDKWRKTEAFNASYWISTSVDILPTFTLEVSSWGQLPSRSLFTTNHGYYSLSTALKKTFLENTLTLSLGADIRLNTYRNSSIYPDGTYSSGDYRWNGTSGWVRLSYRFGNNTASNNRTPRTVSSDSEESSRLGGNGGGSIGK